MVQEIRLTKGAVALVDDADFAALSAFSWHLCSRGYAARRRRKAERTEGQHHISLMHREILNAPAGVQVDHANGDRLDNRRENIRLATRAQNQANAGPSSRNTSGFKGVSREGGRWLAQIKCGGQIRRLGTFLLPEVAAIVYDDAAERCFGEFAKLNFPNGSVTAPVWSFDPSAAFPPAP